MTNSEIRTTKNIKLKEKDKMMKLDLYESRLFGRICYGFGRDEDGYVYIKDDEANTKRIKQSLGYMSPVEYRHNLGVNPGFCVNSLRNLQDDI